MTSAIEGHFDPSDFKLPSLDAPSPPCYTEKRISPVPNTNPKANEDVNYTHRPWLLKKTSVHVESTPSNVLEDNLSDHSSITTTRSDEKRAVRNLLSRFGRQTSGDERPDDRASVADSHETSLFGTTVSIEAGHSKRSQTKQRELKGLEEAASVKRWVGDGKPAEAWGKLAKVSSSAVKDRVNGLALMIAGPRTLGFSRRRFGIFWLSASTRFIQSTIFDTRSYAIRCTHRQASRWLPA